jgi:hypothetical protein
MRKPRLGAGHLWLIRLVTLFVLCGVAAPSPAQEQDAGRQKCILALNKGLGDVARTMRRDAGACLKKAQTGKLPGGQSAATCLTADNKSKVSKSQAKTLSADENYCGKAPDFAYSGALSVNAAAIESELGLLADLFGEDLDAAAISFLADRDGVKCQQAVA